MYGKYESTIHDIIIFAKENPDIIAIIMIGSHTRKIKPADIYSDMDLIICTINPDKYINNSNWLNNFGNVVCSFIETTFDGEKERRALYDDNRDIDFPIQSLNSEESIDFLKNPNLLAVLNKGYRVIYDKTKLIKKNIEISLKSKGPVIENYSISEIENLVNDFYYHIIWATKKIKRKELWTGVNCINNYLAKLLLTMIKYYSMICNNHVLDWHGGRFLEDYIPENITLKLKDCFCRYDENEAIRAINAVHDLFTELSKSVYRKCGYKFNNDQVEHIKKLKDMV